MEPKRNRLKEPFCGISHLVGAGMAVVGLVALLILSHGKPWHTLSFVIYGATLITLYLASGLYHSLHLSDERVEMMKRFDHVGIYLLIAGTYTPVCMVALRGPLGYGILAAEWSMAAIGIFATLVLKKVHNVVRVLLYLCMGWLVMIDMPAVRAVMPPAAVAWLAAGGIIYTLGTIVYATDKPNLWPGRFTAHDLWHVFVLAGSACHFVLMCVFVVHAA
jgi:hemolysin III